LYDLGGNIILEAKVQQRQHLQSCMYRGLTAVPSSVLTPHMSVCNSSPAVTRPAVHSGVERQFLWRCCAGEVEAHRRVDQGVGVSIR
jgi:hypothetical protein